MKNRYQVNYVLIISRFMLRVIIKVVIRFRRDRDVIGFLRAGLLKPRHGLLHVPNRDPNLENPAIGLE